MRFDDKAVLAMVEKEMQRDAEILEAFETFEELDAFIERELMELDIPEELDNF